MIEELMKTYAGGCQCGLVRYEAKMEIEIPSAMTCNCSHCGKKGFILKFIPASDFKLLSGEESLTEYRFNKKQIQHLFCKVCGVESFGRGKGKEGAETIMINLRCVDDLDTATIPTTAFNGKIY